MFLCLVTSIQKFLFPVPMQYECQMLTLFKTGLLRGTAHPSMVMLIAKNQKRPLCLSACLSWRTSEPLVSVTLLRWSCLLHSRVSIYCSRQGWQTPLSQQMVLLENKQLQRDCICQMKTALMQNTWGCLTLTRLRHFSSVYFGVYSNYCPSKKCHFSRCWNLNWFSRRLFYHSHVTA